MNEKKIEPTQAMVDIVELADKLMVMDTRDLLRYALNHPDAPGLFAGEDATDARPWEPLNEDDQVRVGDEVRQELNGVTTIAVVGRVDVEGDPWTTEDRFIGVIDATLRTNYYIDYTDGLRKDGGPADYLAFKLDCAAVPDLPTFIEQGITGFTGSTWAGMLAPAGVPKEIVQRVSTEIARIVRTDEVRARFDELGTFPAGSTPEEFERFIAAETEKWGRVIRTAKVTADG